MSNNNLYLLLYTEIYKRWTQHEISASELLIPTVQCSFFCYLGFWNFN